MLVARFSKAASSLVGATVKAPKSRMARKVSVKSSIFKVSNKYALPSFTKVHARTVTTFSDGLTAEEKAAIEVTDMRGLEQSVEFLTGVPQSQLHRNVTIYRPTPRTVQSGTKVCPLTCFLVSKWLFNLGQSLKCCWEISLTLKSTFPSICSTLRSI